MILTHPTQVIDKPKILEHAISISEQNIQNSPDSDLREIMGIPKITFTQNTDSDVCAWREDAKLKLRLTDLVLSMVFNQAGDHA